MRFEHPVSPLGDLSPGRARSIVDERKNRHASRAVNKVENDYYQGTTSHRNGGGSSGWRRRIGQRLRFEVALQWWEWDAIASVADLGCGGADLADYLERTGRSGSYLGVESRREAVEEARRRRPEVEIQCGDLYDETLVEEPVDLAIAIGAQVDGRERTAASERVGAIRRLVRRCDELGDRGAVIVLLDQEAIDERPALALEPALYGVTREELETLRGELSRPSFVVEDFLQTDLALVLHDAKVDVAPDEIDPWSPHERVIEMGCGDDAAARDAAWLWLEAGRPERARHVLETVSRRDRQTDETRLLYDRLAQME